MDLPLDPSENLYTDASHYFIPVNRNLSMYSISRNTAVGQNTRKLYSRKIPKFTVQIKLNNVRMLNFYTGTVNYSCSTLAEIFCENLYIILERIEENVSVFFLNTTTPTNSTFSWLKCWMFCFRLAAQSSAAASQHSDGTLLPADCDAAAMKFCRVPS